MSRTRARKLPQIAVEEEAVRTRVDLPVALSTELELYARYFASLGGRKPLTMGHVIVGLLETYLTDCADFQKWKQEGANGADTGSSPFAEVAVARERGPSA